MTANAQEIEHWNGDEARHWVEEQERYDRQLAPFADALLEAAALVRPERVLDIGCGCGRTAFLAAERAGEVVGVDISGPMLDHARSEARARGAANVRFEQADAQSRPFDHESFDVAISRFGVMFFDEPVAAFRNVAAALSPNGRFVFVTWQELGRNEWLLVPGAAAAQHVPLPAAASSDGPGMFSLADPDRTRARLTAAGFASVEITSFETPMLVAGGGSLDETMQFLVAGSLGRALLDGAEPAAAARAVDAVSNALTPYHADDGVRLGAAAWVVTARK